MSKEYVSQLEATIENLRRDNALLKEELTKYKNAESTKALECLEDVEVLVNSCYDSNYISDDEYNKLTTEINTIKQALIQAENNRIKLEKSEKIISRLVDKKSKKELAWEIVIKKKVDILGFRRTLSLIKDFKYEDYAKSENIWKLYSGKLLTEEEFELLKECL